MQDKIGLEEHMAIPATLVDSERLVGHSAGWKNLKSNLLDIQEQRLRGMDENGIELTILSLNAPAIQAMLDTNVAIETARIANDHLAEEIDRHPNRFRGFAALPMQDPDAAAAELTRCVKELGFVGGLVNGFTQRDVSGSAIYYDVPEYRQFWKVVSELDVPFYLHPRTQIPERSQEFEGHPWLVSAVWGFARTTSIHALRLIGSGLFDEFPNLQILLGHLGERIPYDLWRIDARMAKTGTAYTGSKPMGQFFRENFHLTTAGNFSDPTLRCALEVVSKDRLMFSADYPFEDMGEASTWFDNTTVLSDAERQQIGRDNAIKLFKLNLD